jgi:bifunctional non-homologous end joining protein LigD
MALESYQAKRDFSSTPEPKGLEAPASGNKFVVQEHDATRLHYDFRLEMDGVLKSWAVPRGPSLVPGEKRLAVAVEDHPLDYADFEGAIAKGEYGAGDVIVWDRGEWSPIGDAGKGYAAGRLDFELHGEKLNGRWHLVRMKRRAREKRDNWLLIKSEDEFAAAEGAPNILEERPDSVLTGRAIGESFEAPPKARSLKKKKIQEAAVAPVAGAPSAVLANLSSVKGAKKGDMPPFVEPMLATLVKSPLKGERWLHEIKFDGYRLQARINGGDVVLLTRAGLDWTKKFGKELVEALAALPVQKALIDGELVVENAGGASDFSLLQADLSEGRCDRLVYYAFDLIHLDGYDLRQAPLIRRKELLAKLVGNGSGVVGLSEHLWDSGELVLRHACRLGLEGVVSKLSDSPYRSGRGKAWIKSKCSQRQEFVVGGFVPATAAREAIGSLALGVYDGGTLRYVGRVGTGFSASAARALYSRLEPMRVASSPFADRLGGDEARGVRFVRPELVAEIDFRAWTADGLLRHASFRALREDKPAGEIVREAPVANAEPKPQHRNVRLTHPDRVYWPDRGLTKEGLADYYAEVWPHIAAFVVRRPLALLRCPDGIDGPHFFQKHVGKGSDRNIMLVQDPKAPADQPLISIHDLDGLMALVQSAALEIHPWGSTIADWERPDTIIIDLDPGDDVAWTEVIASANEVRARLNAAGLVGFVKTSGGKGLHVVAPVKPKADWAAAKALTKAIADEMARDSPEPYVSTIVKAKRRGKIFVDYLRNQRGATAVAAYSTRARPKAPVSMPLGWEELRTEITAAYYTVENAPARLASLPDDPWKDFRAAAAPIELPKTARKRRTA